MRYVEKMMTELFELDFDKRIDSPDLGYQKYQILADGQLIRPSWLTQVLRQFNSEDSQN